jgi:hypothetical protein
MGLSPLRWLISFVDEDLFFLEGGSSFLGPRVCLLLQDLVQSCQLMARVCMKYSFFGLAQPKNKYFTPPWVLKFLLCGTACQAKIR